MILSLVSLGNCSRPSLVSRRRSTSVLVWAPGCLVENVRWLDQLPLSRDWMRSMGSLPLPGSLPLKSIAPPAPAPPEPLSNVSLGPSWPLTLRRIVSEPSIGPEKLTVPEPLTLNTSVPLELSWRNEKRLLAG